MRSKGYTDTHLTFERLPAFLYSESFAMAPIFDGEAVQFEEAGDDRVEEPSLVAELMRQVRERGANSDPDSAVPSPKTDADIVDSARLNGHHLRP